MNNDIGEWYRQVPLFTRYWLSLTLGFSILGRFGIFKAYQLVLLYDPIVHQLQIWRPITALFYYPITPGTGFHFLINCYFLYNYSLRLETGVFDGRPADYCFMLIFNWLCCVIIGLLADIPLLMDPMVLSVLYVWCQLNKDVIVNFWFGSSFKAMYLPWVLLGINMIIAGGGILELVGIVVGHLFYFLMFKYPQEFGGPVLLKTPDILYRWFPNNRNNVHGFGPPPQRRGQPSTGRHNWGQGYVLGGN